MTRTIKASEVEPGMEVEITTVQRMKIVKNYAWGDSHRTLSSDNGHIARLSVDAPVTVLAEPLPEEPTTFGARVVAGGLMFVRGIHHERPWIVNLDGELYDWNDLCKLGSVAVIEAEPYWEVPTDVDSDSEVPKRIEGWPENDAALRAYGWMDRLGSVWRYEHTGATTGWICPGMSPQNQPWGSPFTRVTDPWTLIA